MLIAAALGWLFGGYENFVLVAAIAVRRMLPLERAAAAPAYVGGLLAVTLVGWATGGVALRFDHSRALWQDRRTVPDALSALELADRAHVLQTDRIALVGASREILNNREVRAAYLGL